MNLSSQTSPCVQLRLQVRRRAGSRSPLVWVCAALLSWTLAGCSGSGSTPTGRDAGAGQKDVPAAEVAVSDVPVIPDGAVCLPGEVQGCNPNNNTQILKCAEDGSGIVPIACTGDDGDPTSCIDGACTLCRAGRRRCKPNDDDVVQRCNELGTAWEKAESCNGKVTGRVCEQGGCRKLCDLAEKLFTYMGCDYWAADLDNAFVPGGPRGFYDAQGAQYSIVVSNPDAKLPATVEISNVHGPVTEDADGNPLDLGPIPPGGLRTFNLPRRDVNGTQIAPLAYRVHSSIPITAYQFNPLDNVNVFSNDASLLLPENVLGKYYIVMTREQTFDSLRGYLTVIAVRGGETKISVTVTAPTLPSTEKGPDGKPQIPSMKKGESRSFTLKQWDVLNIETNATAADLTGSIILTDRAVVVFGGSEASNVPNTNHCDMERGACAWQLDQGVPVSQARKCSSHDDCSAYITCCADHMEQQIFPVKTWGKRYMAAKSFDRNKEKDAWRILAAEDGTIVTTFPPQANIPVLDRGQWFEFESREHFEVAADKPILVGQYLAAEQAPDPNVGGIPGPGDAKTGDPAFMLSVPVAQYRKDYTFLAPSAYAFDYVNIIAPVDAVVILDTEVLPPEAFEPITPEYHVARRQIEDGVHSVNSDKPVGIIIYGYDQFVSYGYPGGLDLRDLKLITKPGL